MPHADDSSLYPEQFGLKECSTSPSRNNIIARSHFDASIHFHAETTTDFIISTKELDNSLFRNDQAPRPHHIPARGAQYCSPERPPQHSSNTHGRKPH
ncbi:protein of unknown function [Cyanobium sp. NIES-981]|nr:protein of unknown function [Cyanobium sp. NIES-981]